MKSFVIRKEVKKCILLVFAIAASLSALQGQVQQKQYIKGNLKDRQSMQAVSYATVALLRISDSTLITGTASNMDGEFIIESITNGSYCLIISAIGYNRELKNIELINNYNTGTVLLQEKSVNP